MAKHRIRRWFQFGILDLLILMAVTAIGAVLWRHPRLREPVAQGTTPGQIWSDNSLRMKFCWCPPGDFKMGEPPDQVDVKLTRGFWLGKYEVTQGEYRQVIGGNSSAFSPESGPSMAAGVDTEKLPVESVTWDEAVEFCRVLTEQQQRAGGLPTGWEYRLPTEAQWEYACRAGTQTAYSFGDDASRLVEFAWYFDNAELRTHEVGRKQPNRWGLHDMHGNVWEWGRDWYRPKLPGGADPEVHEGASNHVARGGCWYHDGRRCCSGFRLSRAPDSRFYNLGFRVALAPPAAFR